MSTSVVLAVSLAGAFFVGWLRGNQLAATGSERRPASAPRALPVRPLRRVERPCASHGRALQRPSVA